MHLTTGIRLVTQSRCEVEIDISAISLWIFSELILEFLDAVFSGITPYTFGVVCLLCMYFKNRGKIISLEVLSTVTSGWFNFDACTMKRLPILALDTRTSSDNPKYADA